MVPPTTIAASISTIASTSSSSTNPSNRHQLPLRQPPAALEDGRAAPTGSALATGDGQHQPDRDSRKTGDNRAAAASDAGDLPVAGSTAPIAISTADQRDGTGHQRKAEDQQRARDEGKRREAVPDRLRRRWSTARAPGGSMASCADHADEHRDQRQGHVHPCPSTAILRLGASTPVDHGREARTAPARPADEQPAVARKNRRVSSHACESESLAMNPPLLPCAALCGPGGSAQSHLRPAPATRHVARRMELIGDIEWRVSDAPVPYEEALAFMEERAAAIRAGDGSASASGCSSIRRCSPPGPAPTRPSCSTRSAFPGLRGRARRPLHLSRPRPAGRLCLLDLEKRGKDIRRFVHRARRLDDRRARPSSASPPTARPAASASGSAKAPARPRSARSASA